MEARCNKNYEPGRRIPIKVLLRCTLQLLLINEQSAQVSDTTGDDQRTKADTKKLYYAKKLF